MSFGFGVGDFLAVLKLANKVRKDFVGAPKQLKDNSDELRGLSIVLSDVDVNLSDAKLSQEQQQNLAELVSSCQSVLKDLQDVLTKLYDEPRPPDPSIRTGIKRVWKRLGCEPEDICKLRHRIVSVVALLNAYIDGLMNQNIVAIRTGVARLTIRECDKERFGILDWLTTTEYAAQHHDFISRRQEGTGQWFLESTEYQTWVGAASATRTLYCPGIPGAGKTILTSIVIDDLMARCSPETADCGLAYIYFNFRRHEQQKFPDVMSNAIDESPHEDGCRAAFLDGIFRLQDTSSVPILFLATSRFIPDIASVFSRRPTTETVEIRASPQDIGHYVEGHWSRLLPFVQRNPQLRVEIKDAIIQAVDGMFLLARIYHSSLGDKATPKAIRKALSKFKQQEPGLSEESKVQILRQAYDGVMERITNQPPGFKDLAMQTLSWITCATRPLKTAELQHALAVEIGHSKLDPDNIPEVEDILGVCAGLVTRDEESDVIRLVHFTTQEYFEETQVQWFPNAHEIVTVICATYLLFEVFASGPCASDPKMTTRVMDNGFYNYAARNFPVHATKAASDCPELITLFKDIHNMKCQSAYQAYLLDNDWGPSSMSFEERSGIRTITLDDELKEAIRHMDLDPAFAAAIKAPSLQLAIGFRLPRVVERLLDLGYDPNTGTEKSRGEQNHMISQAGPELLSGFALDEEHIDFSDVLLTSPEVAAEDEGAAYTDSPLHWAIRTAQTEVVRMLLSRCGINVNARGINGCTPLHFAVRMRDGESLKQLLSYPGIEVNLADHKASGTPLHHLLWGWRAEYTCDIGHFVKSISSPRAEVYLEEELASLPLSAPDINALARYKDGDTPLVLVARWESTDLLELLLTKWTAEAQEEWHSSAIRALDDATGANRPDVIRVLLADSRLGIDLATDTGEGSAICRAASATTVVSPGVKMWREISVPVLFVADIMVARERVLSVEEMLGEEV